MDFFDCLDALGDIIGGLLTSSHFWSWTFGLAMGMGIMYLAYHL